MSKKRISMDDRLKEEGKNYKYAKAISAYTSETKEEINDNIDTNINNTSDENVNVTNSEDKNVNNVVSSDANNNVSNIVDKFVILKKQKQVETKRSTYYLMPHTIKKIEELSKKTGLGKSALVQKLLEQALDLVEIQ